MEMTQGKYRYTLRRSWPGGQGRVCWVMLNPSTADARADDPTIRRVIRFSRDHGFAELVVVNVFAARAKTPRELADLSDGGVDVGGRGNRQAVTAAIRRADTVVVAWGSSVPAGLRRQADRTIRAITQRCRRAGITPHCLATTSQGAPRHPLYMAATTRLAPWVESDGMSSSSLPVL